MFKGLPQLIVRADYSTVISTNFDETREWPDGELDRCLAAGLLFPAEPALGLCCEECGEYEDVMMIDSIVSPPCVPYLRCGEVGSYRIDPQRLQRWQVSIPQLLDALFRGIALLGNRTELAHQRLWRLGKCRWAGKHWTVFFGRALHCRDACGLLRVADFPPQSVLFVPSMLPVTDHGIEQMPPVIGLDTLVTWKDGQLHFDQNQVEEQLAVELAATQIPLTEKRIRKRGSRPANINALRREIEEHLRSARDHAVVTLERSGTPELLPRPTLDFLARRLRVDKSTVSRCLEDESAHALRQLWELAGDLDQLLDAAGHRS